MAVSISAACRSVAVIGPAVSWLWLIGTTCRRLISPTVGFKPTMPFMAAGQVTEPSVSVPTAKSTNWAATAAPLPDDDPQVLRFSACGLRVCPPTALQPEMEASARMLAHSDKLVLPRMMAPAARSRATSGASRPVTLPASARLPAVVGSGPMVSTLSFTSTGWPNSGPFGALLASSALAWSSAVGSSAITAFSRGFMACTRAMAARVLISAAPITAGAALAALASSIAANVTRIIISTPGCKPLAPCLILRNGKAPDARYTRYQCPDCRT